MKTFLSFIAIAILSVAFVSAADTPASKPSVLQLEKGHDMTQFTSGFLFTSGMHSIGKMSIPAPEKSTDLNKLVSNLSGSKWHVHCLLIDRDEPGLKTGIILLPEITAATTMITVTGLKFKSTDQLVNSYAGYPATFVYEDKTLKLKIGTGESFDIVTRDDVSKAQASLANAPKKSVAQN